MFKLFLGGAFLLLITSGCLHLEQTIDIHQDGSLSVEYHYIFTEDQIRILAASQAQIDQWQSHEPSPALPPLFDRQQALNYFSGDGIKLKNYRSYVAKGRRHVIIQCEAQKARQALDSGKFGDFVLEKNAQGDLDFKAEMIGDGPVTSANPGLLNALSHAKEPFYLKLTVNTPTKILQTSAKDQQKRQAVWEYSVAPTASELPELPRISLTFSGTR
jgi:hypothetical protein